MVIAVLFVDRARSIVRASNLRGDNAGKQGPDSTFGDITFFDPGQSSVISPIIFLNRP